MGANGTIGGATHGYGPINAGMIKTNNGSSTQNNMQTFNHIPMQMNVFNKNPSSNSN